MKGRLVFKTVHIDTYNVDRSLVRRKAKLSRLHGGYSSSTSYT